MILTNHVSWRNPVSFLSEILFLIVLLLHQHTHAPLPDGVPCRSGCGKICIKILGYLLFLSIWRICRESLLELLLLSVCQSPQTDHTASAFSFVLMLVWVFELLQNFSSTSLPIASHSEHHAVQSSLLGLHCHIYHILSVLDLTREENTRFAMNVAQTQSAVQQKTIYYGKCVVFYQHLQVW